MIDWYRFPEDLDEAPASEGVYMLSETDSEKGILYVGRADNLHERLSQHPDQNNPCLQRRRINYFTYEITTNSEGRERELIRDYSPDCNRD